MVVGKLLFGFVLGSITSTLANADSQKVQYDEKVQAVKVTVRISDRFCSSFAFEDSFVNRNVVD